MRKEFYKELEESGWIHKPLKLNMEDSMEEERKSARVLKKKVLWNGKNEGVFQNRDQGICRIVQREDGECLYMEGRLRQNCWPFSMPQDGDCAYFGNLRGALPVKHQDWREYNRLSFQVYPIFRGMHTISFSAWIRNEGKEKVPDRYNRTGQHMVNLENRTWNLCIWELSALARDRVTELEFCYRLSGSDTGMGETAGFYIRDICLEKTEEPEKQEGWELESGKICYDTCGYLPWEEKYALTDGRETSFSVEDAENGSLIMKKSVQILDWEKRRFGRLDFSSLPPGEYRIRTGELVSDTFQVGTDWAEEMFYKGLNFIFCQRCGYPVPGKHGCCHTDCYGIHGKLRIPYWGGWHDAGDMSQQTAQTAETCEALFWAAMDNRENTALYTRTMEEACWGLSFLLQTRAGDGFRATSLGLIRWTDGKQGNLDDGASVRVNCHGVDNFICACAEAAGARALKEYDAPMGEGALRAAEEDYRFAMERFRSYGFEVPIMWEHTSGSSDSLCCAVISKAAALLFLETGKENYRTDALNWGEKLLECQEKKGDVKGFFYRDASCSHAVHFNHQAREQYFPQALVLLCRILEKDEKKKFEDALKLYGTYLENLFALSSPYRMMPAGIYREEEAEDQEIFKRMHLQAEYKECKEGYKEQVRNGKDLGAGNFLRQFPVWFSFRGNLGVQLSMGEAALITGRFLENQKLVQASAEQIHWINGKNPFCQSLMTGNGKRFGCFYAVFPGLCAGQIPVGIQTKKNEDIPFWPAGNQATYREVWLSCTIKMMGICGKFIKKPWKKQEDLF